MQFFASSAFKDGEINVLISGGEEPWKSALLSLFEKDGCRSRAELVTAVETGNFENEQVPKDLALELGYKISCRLSRAT